MDWSGATTILNEIKAPAGYTLAQMSRENVLPTVDALRRWYPEILVGAESCHLTADFYNHHTLLRGTSDDRPVFPIVAKHDEAIVGMITFEKNSLSRTITCRLGAVDPQHRGTLGLLGAMLLEKVGRAIGAELAYYFATLKSLHQQVLAERLRYQLVGIVPAFDRDMVREGEVKRVYEAIYAKVLVSDDAVQLPEATNLTEKTQAVWQTLFGSLQGPPNRSSTPA